MTSKLPLIRLSAINPFLLELRRRGADAESLLQSLGLPGDIPASDELFVSSLAIYELVERSAETAGDPRLGFQIGNALELHAWDPIALAADESRTVGELLNRFIVHAAEHSSATNFYLRADGERATFGFERVVPPPFRQGQGDAFYVGFIARMLMHATQSLWDVSEVMFHIADPYCIPQDHQPYRVAASDSPGMRVSFPSTWLFEPFEKSAFHIDGSNKPRDPLPYSLINSMRAALEPHLHEPDLTVERASQICGHDRRRLSRELSSEGTTISKQIAKLRAEKAEKDLAETSHRVADIAQTVGFTDPTVFSRAFKNWTGQSPQEYRRTHRSPNQ